MSEWQTFCLKDLGKIVGGATPPTNNPKNYGNKIAWITPKDLSTLQGRYIKKGSRSISRLGFKSCSTFLLPKHAILFSVRAPIGYTAIISKRSCTGGGLMGLVPNKKFILNFYTTYSNTIRITSLTWELALLLRVFQSQL